MALREKLWVKIDLILNIDEMTRFFVVLSKPILIVFPVVPIKHTQECKQKTTPQITNQKSSNYTKLQQNT